MMDNVENKCKSSFSNPFAGGPGWELKLTPTSRGAKGVYKIWEESGDPDRDGKIAKIINNGIFMTAVQVSQSGTLNMGSDNIKKKMNLLSRGLFLIKHTIEHDNRALPIYTIGPASCENALDMIYRHNFYMKYSLTDILRILSVNQLVIKLVKDNYVKVNYKVMEPYTAEIEFINRKYGNPYENRDKTQKLSIISLRNYKNEEDEFVRQITKVQEKTIVIAHDLSIVEKYARLMDDNFRVTTDDILFREKIEDILYKPENGELIREISTNLR